MNVKTLIQCKPIESTVNNINLPKGNTETKIVLPYPRMRQYMCLITQKSHPNTILVRKQNFLDHLFFFFLPRVSKGHKFIIYMPKWYLVRVCWQSGERGRPFGMAADLRGSCTRPVPLRAKTPQPYPE